MNSQREKNFIKRDYLVLMVLMVLSAINQYTINELKSSSKTIFEREKD